MKKWLIPLVGIAAVTVIVCFCIANDIDGTVAKAGFAAIGVLTGVGGLKIYQGVKKNG